MACNQLIIALLMVSGVTWTWAQATSTETSSTTETTVWPSTTESSISEATTTSETSTSETSTSGTSSSDTSTSGHSTSVTSGSLTSTSEHTATNSSTTETEVTQTSGFVCLGDAEAFDAGFGNCRSYSGDIDEVVNHHYCSNDIDNETGLSAAQVCPECLLCQVPSNVTDATTTSETTTSVTTWKAMPSVEPGSSSSAADWVSTTVTATTTPLVNIEDSGSAAKATCYAFGVSLLALLPMRF